MQLIIPWIINQFLPKNLARDSGGLYGILVGYLPLDFDSFETLIIFLSFLPDKQFITHWALMWGSICTKREGRQYPMDDQF
jgi:hypothetical protein